LDWIVQCFTSPPTQYTVGYMGDGFYRSKVSKYWRRKL